MDFDLRILRYFVKVVERESISQAAEQLSLTQPALSRIMKKFEEEMGWKLFDRGPKSLTVTAEGTIVAEEARKLLRRAGESYQRMTRSIEGEEIRIGYAPTLGRELIQNAIGTYVEAFRAVRFDLHDCTTQEMWAGLRENRLDLILEVATQDPEIQWHPLMQRQFRIAMKAEHPHAGRRQLSPSEIDGERILLLSRRDYPGYWEQVTTYFESQGINAQVAGEFDGQESLSLAVKAGLGIAFVAEGHDLGESMISLPLVPAPEPICVALGWLADRELKPWIADFVSVFPEVPGEPLSSFHAGTVGQEGG